MRTAFWTVALAAALLWPSRSISAFDGVPLDRAAETIVIGVIVPILWCLDRTILERTMTRVLILSVLLLKIGSVLFVQEGLCARFSTTAPLSGEVLTIPIDEPLGVLRSWDVRADWRAANPACTAIVDRPYRSASEFPAWFVNFLDQLRPGARDISLAMTGAITVPTDGTFTIKTGEDMRLHGRIGDADVNADNGRDLELQLAPGTYAIALEGHMTGERWRLVPEWNGEPAFRRALLTTSGPDRVPERARRWVSFLTTSLVLLIVCAWAMVALARVSPGAPALAWVLAVSAVMIAVGASGRYERLAPLLLAGAVAVPVADRKQTLRSAFFLVGVPTLAYFAARALPLVGHFSIYSWDDWLAYQLAGGRIYMHGFWLEGGTKTFDYQPLYRWINGALHLVFGDSSVGETYVDAACLVAGSLLTFALVRSIGGFRAALLACIGTLATFTLGTPWYFVGRGLSEIAAAGFAFATVFVLLRRDIDATTRAAAAGLLAVLTFYTRLNHLLFVASMAAFMLPPSTTLRIDSLTNGVRSFPRRAAAIYLAVLAAGVGLFAVRTWWYTGVFSILYGTSLKNNDTGLRLTTIASLEPWRKVAHSLSALVWMNEPPHADVRALLVGAGVLVAILAVLQVPRFRGAPAAIVAVLFGAMLSAFLAHAHGYPGRMSIHLIPFAVSAAAAGAIRLARPSPKLVARAHRRGASEQVA